MSSTDGRRKREEREGREGGRSDEGTVVCFCFPVNSCCCFGASFQSTTQARQRIFGSALCTAALFLRCSLFALSPQSSDGLQGGGNNRHQCAASGWLEVAPVLRERRLLGAMHSFATDGRCTPLLYRPAKCRRFCSCDGDSCFSNSRSLFVRGRSESHLLQDGQTGPRQPQADCNLTIGQRQQTRTDSIGRFLLPCLKRQSNASVEEVANCVSGSTRTHGHFSRPTRLDHFRVSGSFSRRPR